MTKIFTARLNQEIRKSGKENFPRHAKAWTPNVFPLKRLKPFPARSVAQAEA
jgi:hypothetical protein